MFLFENHSCSGEVLRILNCSERFLRTLC